MVHRRTRSAPFQSCVGNPNVSLDFMIEIMADLGMIIKGGRLPASDALRAKRIFALRSINPGYALLDALVSTTCATNAFPNLRSYSCFIRLRRARA